MSLLADEAYEALFFDSDDTVTLEDAPALVGSLGRSLVEPPPREGWLTARISKVSSTPVSYDLAVPLWTRDGPADVAICLRVTATSHGTFERNVAGFASVHDLPPPSFAAVLDAGGLANRQVPSDSSPGARAMAPLARRACRSSCSEDYIGLARDGLVSNATGLEDESIGTWIERYPGTLVPLPREAWDYSDHMALNVAGGWWVTIDLWTAEEGRSDLTIEATVWDDGRNVRVELQNVHVM